MDEGNVTVEVVLGSSLNYAYGTLLILAIAVFTIILAVAFNYISQLINKDELNLDVVFDAGGKVSLGLTAATIVSQWTWAATLLQSCTVAIKYGISGPFWYAAGATIQILLFSIICIKLKILAPGAKTFVQFVRFRFGMRAHKVYCFYALMTNMIVTAMLMLGGALVITDLIGDYNMEMSILMMCASIGGYTMVGGLGATFYASYFNTVIVFCSMIIFAIAIFINGESLGFGTFPEMYERISSLKGPDGNRQNSYLTFYSQGGLMFGIINIIGNFGTVFMDQAYWQSAIAARPMDGVRGFLLGGMVWFAVPFTFATTMGLGYLSLSYMSDQPLLTDDQINSGMVPMAVAASLSPGYSVAILLMIIMAVTSTGSAEIVAVASILIYDIYMVYILPFREIDEKVTDICILCARFRGRKATNDDPCECISVSYCTKCRLDDQLRKTVRSAVKPSFTCPMHAAYRNYSELMSEKKDWCVLLATIVIIPLSLILSVLGVSLGWVYLFMGVMIGSSVVPVSLSMFWDGVTPLAMIISPPVGTVCALISWVVIASTYEGGLGNFLQNTGRDFPMLVGNLVSIGVGGVVCFVVSYVQSRNISWTERIEQWQVTLDIDNPLFPWAEIYRADFKEDPLTAGKLDERPGLADIQKRYAKPRRASTISALALTVFLIVVWPSINLLLNVFSMTTFRVWVGISLAWMAIGALLIIIVPVVSEFISLRNAYKESQNKVHPIEETTMFVKAQVGRADRFRKTPLFLIRAHNYE